MEKGLVTLDTSDATHQPWVEKRDTVASMMPADGKKRQKTNRAHATRVTDAPWRREAPRASGARHKWGSTQPPGKRASADTNTIRAQIQRHNATTILSVVL